MRFVRSGSSGSFRGSRRFGSSRRFIGSLRVWKLLKVKKFQEVWKVQKFKSFLGGPEGLRGSKGQGYPEVIDVWKKPEVSGRSGRFRKSERSRRIGVMRVWKQKKNGFYLNHL